MNRSSTWGGSGSARSAAAKDRTAAVPEAAAPMTSRASTPSFQFSRMPMAVPSFCL